LRSTGWIEVADKAPPPSRKKLVLIAASALLAVVAVSAGVLALKHHNKQQSLAVQTGTRATADTQSLGAAFESGAAVQALAAECHAQAPLAKAREALDAIRRKISAVNHRINDRPEAVPAVRTTNALAQSLSGPQSLFSSLDLARVLGAVLRDARVSFEFARRTTGTRPNTPPDPTGVLGRYVVIVENVALDPVDGQAIARTEARPIVMPIEAVNGAMLVQSALAEQHAGHHSQALTQITQAIANWGDGGIAHAARAYLTRNEGVAPQEVLRDLDTAVVATNDDPAIHLLRAHTAVSFGEPAIARTSAQLAWQKARGWGDAALAAALTYTPAPSTDSGVTDRGRCERFLDARESWTDDALTACPALDSSQDPSETQLTAARRVASQTTDPMRLAFAMAALHSTQGIAISPSARTEVLGWLLLAGATQTARELVRTPDAGP
jgi:hypothetical protein